MLAQYSKIKILIQILENQSQYYDKKVFKNVPDLYEQNYSNFSIF